MNWQGLQTMTSYCVLMHWNKLSRSFGLHLDAQLLLYFFKGKWMQNYQVTLCVCINGSAVSESLWLHGLQPTRLLHPWDSPGKNPGVGCHLLLQGISLAQGSNLGLLHCRQILCHLSHQGRHKVTLGSENISFP